jgi:hypothetical protein
MYKKQMEKGICTRGREEEGGGWWVPAVIVTEVVVSRCPGMPVVVICKGERVVQWWVFN